MEMANERDQSARAVMMRTVYYIAKASKPNSDFGNLIELQALNGCPDLENVGPYHHHSVVTEMEQCIANVISKDIKQAIHTSPFVSLLIDETVNVTIHKKLIVFNRYTDENGCAKTVFNHGPRYHSLAYPLPDLGTTASPGFLSGSAVANPSLSYYLKGQCLKKKAFWDFRTWS